MKGLKDFVVHISERYKDTYKTEGGLELYADRRWSAKELANTIVEVVETPLNYDGPIKKGCNLFIDPTVIFNQMYQKTGEQENINLLDRDEKLYKVEPEMIIAYLVEKGGYWKGYGKNFLAERIVEEQEEVKSSLIIMPESKPKEVKGKVKAFILNEFLEEQGIEFGDELFVKEFSYVDVKLRNKKLVWYHSSDALAKA